MLTNVYVCYLLNSLETNVNESDKTWKDVIVLEHTSCQVADNKKVSVVFK